MPQMRGHSLNSGSITQHLHSASMPQIVGGDGADARLFAQPVDDSVDCCGCEGLSEIPVTGRDEDVLAFDCPLIVQRFQFT